MKGVFLPLPAYLVKLHKEKMNKDLHTPGHRKKFQKKEINYVFRACSSFY